MILPRHKKSIRLWTAAAPAAGAALRLFVFAIFLIPYSLFLFPSSASASLTDGLVGYWTLDGKDTNWAAGLTNDLSGNGNNGSLINMSTTTSPTKGKLGAALNFDGVNDYVSVPQNGNFSLSATAFTIAAWVLDDTNLTSGYNRLVSWRDGANYIQLALRGRQYELLNGALGGTYNAATAASVPLGWHHIVATFDGATYTMYLNGVVSSAAVVGNSAGGPPDSTTLFLGQRGDASGFMTGKLDDARIYNRVLSQQEITQLYKLGQAKYAVAPTNSLTNGLVGYWTFDGKDTNWATGLTNDLSGNGNNGSLINMSTTTTPAKGKLGQAFNFNSSNNYVTAGTPTTLNQLATLSVSVWIMPRSSGVGNSLGRIVGKDNSQSAGSWGIPILGASLSSCASVLSSGIAFTKKNTVGTSYAAKCSADGVITYGAWQHIVVTWDGSTGETGVHMYKNGQEVSYTSSAGTSGSVGDDTSLPFLIGNVTAVNRAFDGKIDDVRVYNRVLSATEITQLYKQGAAKLGVSPAVSAGQSLNNGLVGYWTMDGKYTNWTTGQETDLSGQGNTGQLINMSTTTSPALGKIGQALNFDGVDDMVVVSPASSINDLGPLTYSAWIKPRTAGGGSVGKIVSKDGITSGTIQFSVISTGLTGCTTPTKALYFAKSGAPTNVGRCSVDNIISFNAWQYVVVTWDGSVNASGVHIYKDGSEVSYNDGATNASSLNSDAALNFYIGNRLGANRTFDGTIDDVRVYNRALSATEVLQIYKQGLGKSR